MARFVGNIIQIEIFLTVITNNKTYIHESDTSIYALVAGYGSQGQIGL